MFSDELCEIRVSVCFNTKLTNVLEARDIVSMPLDTIPIAMFNQMTDIA